jgi:hypothetical protein
MIVLRAVVVLVAGIACAAAPPASTRATALTITYWPDEQRPTFERWTLRCDPAGGTLPDARRACRKLSSRTATFFAPVPRTAVCTEIYGGPQKAVVKGAIAGRRIWASFRRRNGCEIARWQRFSPWLLPAGGVAR